MKKRLVYALAVFFLVTALACKKQFTPSLNTTFTNFLSVDGVILSGDSTMFTLSRTTSLNDTTRFKAELKATVVVEDDQKTLYPLVEKSKGQYVLGVTNFGAARKYRLNIKTNDGKIYQSDFVPLKITPQIDNVYQEYPNDDRLEFYVDTHDPTNKTRYYRWDYKEVWQYYSVAHSSTFPNATFPIFNYVNNSFFEILPQRDLTTCYATGHSNEILIGSSAKLIDDKIIKQPIGAIMSNSQKIEKTYSIQIRQYALTEEGFNYYQNIKKNTEQLGTIFDGQPSLTIGNIHCLSNVNEQVLGFISASTVANRLLILDYNDLRLRINFPGDRTNLGDPMWANPTYIGPPSFEYCSAGSFNGTILLEPASTFNSRLSQLLNGGTGFKVIIDGYVRNNINGVQTIVGYSWRRRECLDCRLINREGGSVTLTRPPFFPPL